MSKPDVRALVENITRVDDPEQKEAAEAALARFALKAAPPEREEAVLALVAIGSSKDVQICDQLFRDDGDGLAGRLLARLTDGAAPTADSLIEALRTGGVPGVPWIIATRVVADHGADAVPALVTALESFPLPALDKEDWMLDESAKYYLIHALMDIGPAAVAAVPVLQAISTDEEAYRDSRWIAKRALAAIDPASRS